jgi:large subunit ribosomal protein L15
MLSKPAGPVKILGRGEVSVALKVSVHRISTSARAKIEAAGGTVEII